MSLLRQAKYQHMHVDWYLPGDWIGSPGFIVAPREEQVSSFGAKFLGPRSSFDACLVVAPDPAPDIRELQIPVHALPLLELYVP